MKHRHKKHAEGGKIKPHLYNAKGSPEASEAMDEKDGFKRGGKKKHGGKVHGHKASKRLDKRARGGGMKSPFSSAHGEGTLPSKQNSGKGSGHEREQPSDTDEN